MHLMKALANWSAPGFPAALKAELEALPLEALPLQQGLRQAACVSARPVTATIFNSRDDAQHIYVRVGILYNGLVNGCSCADDPSADVETNEYCLLQLRIDKRNAHTVVTLLDE